MDISSLKLQQVAAEIQETASEEKLQQVVAELQVVANESEEGLLSDEVDVGSAFLMIWQFLFP